MHSDFTRTRDNQTSDLLLHNLILLPFLPILVSLEGMLYGLFKTKNIEKTSLEVLALIV